MDSNPCLGGPDHPGDNVPLSENLRNVSTFTEAAPTILEAASYAYRDDEGGAPLPDATLSTNLSSGGHRLELNKPTDIMMANTNGFDMSAGGKPKPLSARVGEHLTEWDEIGGAL